ncbi:helix-turn-helix transcriptional regulator [Cystobacter fuscus]|uniref:Helix-turn-helix transcriptional regulator n=2 Tax=Cystobacter fuscus TaxID=43 RepID=A0A250ITR0_9BACT|nr:helix-turn-helix transcriptional regulator [Cystobacter fuscus]
MDLPDFNKKQHLLAYELMHAFLDSWTLSELHESTEADLARLFQADHVALCLMDPSLPTGFDWKARETASFLQGYYQWFQEDFVFQWLSRQPNTALSDTEMLRGEKLENTETYRRSRQAHLRLRHVLSVLISPESQQGQGAVALYSDRSKPFSEEHRLILQWFTPFLKSAFHNVMRLASLGFRQQLLEALAHQTSASLVLTEQSRELLRTAPVTPLLEKWFSRSSLNLAGIPRDWVERLTELVRTERDPVPGRDTWRSNRPGEELKVTFRRLPRLENGRFWEVTMEEFMLLPREWLRILTPRQIEVATCLVREGCDDEELTRLLKGEREKYSVETVKTHLRAIYKRVGAEGRTDFISRALRP